MPISIRALRPSYPAFAGEVSGIDITRPIGREDVAAIEAGMDTYAVLVFRGQDLTDEQQLAFTLNFGVLERYKTPGHVRKREDNRLGPGIADFSNLDKHGNIMSPEDRVWFFKLGDHLWHSDSSFRPVPAKYSLLSGRIIPSWGPTPSLPTCAGPTTPSTRAPRPRSRTSSASTPDLLARGDRLHRPHARGDRRVPAGAPAPGAHAPGHRPQVAVPVRARRRHRRLDGARGPDVPARPDRARDAAGIRVLARRGGPATW